MNGEAVFDGAAVVDSCDEGDVSLSRMMGAGKHPDTPHWREPRIQKS